MADIVVIRCVHSAEEYFLRTLFDSLNSQQVQYAVMRNHLSLPHSSGGSDLDILIDSETAERTKNIAIDAVRIAGGEPIGVSETVGFFKIFALGQVPDGSNRWWGLRLDFNVGVNFRGLSIVNLVLPWPVDTYRNIPVLADGFAATLGVLKEVLNNGVYPFRYASHARNALVYNPSEINTSLAPLGEKALRRLMGLILASDVSENDRRQECLLVRKEVLKYVFLTSPIKFCRQILLYELSKIRRFFKPSGLTVAVLGVDGAGKSSIINAIMPVLNAATHNSVTLLHLRPSIFPPLGRLFGRGKFNAGSVSEPHAAKPSGKIGSFFRLAYLVMDYVFGYWLSIRPKISKQPTLVIFDRYAYDMALDPRRFRIGLSARFIEFFIRLVPHPDIIICLYGNPEIIASRKNELSLVETRRQVDAIIDFAAKERRAVLISSDGDLGDTYNQVLTAILQKLKARWNR